MHRFALLLYSLGAGTAALTGDLTLTLGTNTGTAPSPMFQLRDPNGSNRNVLLPLLTGTQSESTGIWYFIRNTGSANNLVVKDSTGTTTYATLAPGQWAWMLASGTTATWQVVASLSDIAGLTLTGTLTAVAGVFTGAVTTTDGVTSGTARKVGGLAYAATSAVTLTNSTSETTLGSYTIPANTLKAGTSLRFRAAVRVTGNAAADTITFKGKLGSTALFTSAAVAMVANDIAIVEGHITSRAAPGASAAVASNVRATVTVGGTASSVGSAPAPSNFATNGALVLALTGQWSAASASDIAICDQFDVWAEG